MMFKFRFHTGPMTVKEVVLRLSDANIPAMAGTEHAYGRIDTISYDDAVKRINHAVGYRAASIANVWQEKP